MAVIADGDHAELVRRADMLASRLGLPMATGSGDARFVALLTVTADRLELRETGAGRSGPVFVDFVGGRMGRRRTNVAGTERMLAKAVGFKGKPLRVVDATAGLGRDAFLLACMGCSVTAIERSAVVAALLADGLERARQKPQLTTVVDDRLRLIVGDAREYLQTLREQARPDVVYLDPMFPSRGKSALAKKEMRVCRLVSGDDADASGLLEAALAVAGDRVVVKRPLRALPLGANPDITYKGKTIRYDVYKPALGRSGPG
jgi:16S rRNA (guanine1516-N2)-methyltransferase